MSDRPAFHYHFDWDPVKAARNRSKHGVSFEQAAMVFQDALALTVYDDEHSSDEERWVTMGQTSEGMLLVVVHTFQFLDAQNARVRLISARPASKRERRDYEAGP